MAELVRGIRWGVEQRLEFIEFRLFWEGGINRVALKEQFGISIPQASYDLKRYSDEAPGNLVYDKRLKRYFASDEFRPKFLVPDADQHLDRLRSASNDKAVQADAWFSQMPSAESMPLPHRRIEVDVLRRLLDSIHRVRALRILYQSMNPTRPEPLWRWISPHAFANDGLRWHVRAFCHLDRKFTDFLLPRCLKTGGDGPQEASANEDRNWHEYFNVVLVPNPNLSSSQRNVVAQDYCMRKGRVSIPVRRSFLYYFQKRLRLDVAQTHDNARETPVIVENDREFRAAVHEADR